MLSKNKIFIPFSLGIGILFTASLGSCGFAYDKKIIGKYHIIGVDTKTDLSLSYVLNSGDGLGKAPGRIKQYGFNDTFLVAKTLGYRDTVASYYIIDMHKDSEIAEEKIFRVGPLTEEEYNRSWKKRLNIQLIDVE
jgi:hypothetical protein